MERTSAGNPPFYEVYGKRYTVMKSSSGYRERGVASWYGKKFHGRSTSNGERYDMYKMTAAHKTLPLPTNVRVTNLNNGRSVILRVNDRGPFVKNRLIDLSYAAAKELDIIRDGTGFVEVVALDRGTRSAAGPVTASTTSGSPQARQRMYVQVGAFGEQQNALALARRLKSGGVSKVFVHESGRSPVIYRVRIGPISGAGEFDRVVQEVEDLQIREAHLVVEPG